MYIVTANEMQQMDRKTIKSFGVPGRILMENAGREAVRIFLKTFDGLSGKKVGIMAGRGNNGGDGFVMARYLAQKNISVTVYLLSASSRLTGDAAANFRLLAPLHIPVYELSDHDAFSRVKVSMRQQDIWVDAILGTGLNSDVRGYFKKVIEFINRRGKPVLAVDIPSGLNADTGQPCGVCIRAHTTATFGFAKIGHILFPGAVYTGDLEIVDIGIPPYIADSIGPRQYLLTKNYVADYLQPRTPDAHKGSTGHLLVIAGSPGKTGAAAMTAMSAMRSGAGLVTLGLPAGLNPVLEAQVLEVMTRPLPETVDGLLAEASVDQIRGLLSDKKCLAIGPGLGVTDETRSLVFELIRNCPVPVVIDADGLNCLAGHTAILKNRKNPVVLTPHPGEMARLMDTTVSQIQANRIDSARKFAERFNVVVVLKGACTIVAHPDGKAFMNPTGNPGMASGGMGDVLTGIIAGLITQGYPPGTGAEIGVYLHGASADELTGTCGPFGILASDVMHGIPAQIGKLLDV